MTDNRAERAAVWLEELADTMRDPKDEFGLTGAAKLLREQAATIRNLNIALAGEDVTVGID